MLGPLPQELNTGVYNAYGFTLYGQFMQRVVALEEGTMSLKEADNDVFKLLGFYGGVNIGVAPYLVRDASSKSQRPDLYRMFVDWSTSTDQPSVVRKKQKQNVSFAFGVIDFPIAPPQTQCLDSLTSEVLVEDLIAVDAMRNMSLTMQSAVRTKVGEPSVALSFAEIRLQWQKELLKRVSTPEKAVV